MVLDPVHRRPGGDRGPGRTVVGHAVLVQPPCSHRAHRPRPAGTALDRRAVPHRAAHPGRRRRATGGLRCAAALGGALSRPPAGPSSRGGGTPGRGVRVLAVLPLGLRPRPGHPSDQQDHLPDLAGAGLARSAGWARAGRALRPPPRKASVPQGDQAALRSAPPARSAKSSPPRSPQSCTKSPAIPTPSSTTPWRGR